MASSATYPDIGYNCVKWATPKEQVDLASSQYSQGVGITLFATIYLLWGLVSLSRRDMFTRTPNIKMAMPFIISGAIAMGTGVALVQQKSNMDRVYTEKTQNLLNAGWAAVVAPLAMGLIWFLGDLVTLQARQRSAGYTVM